MDDLVHKAAPAGWLDALERSEAQAATGHVVPADKIKADLAASIARLQAKATAPQDKPSNS